MRRLRVQFLPSARMKDLKTFVDKRLTAMETTPQMWASCKEAFAAQIVVLLEVLEVCEANSLMNETFGQPGTCQALGMEDEVDDEWARNLIRDARSRISEDIP